MKEPANALTFLALVSIGLVSSAVEAQDSKTAAAANAKEPNKTLDLRPPDIRKILKPAQLADTTARASIEDVEVQGTRELLPQTDSESPQPWMGPAAVVWALFHPASAWRIVAPLTPEQAQRMNGRPDLDREIFQLTIRR